MAVIYRNGFRIHVTHNQSLVLSVDLETSMVSGGTPWREI